MTTQANRFPADNPDMKSRRRSSKPTPVQRAGQAADHATDEGSDSKPFGRSDEYRDAQNDPTWRTFVTDAKEYRTALRRARRSG